MKHSRRGFLSSLPVAALGSPLVTALRPDWAKLTAALPPQSEAQPPTATADDEEFWRPIQQAFTVDRAYINLNNGGCCPSPRIVQESVRRHLDLSNTAPVHAMWKLIEPRVEHVRQQMARLFGCSSNEIAITRNASESLETCIFGLTLKAGDEVLASNQNYPRMLQSWRQRVARDQIKLTTFSVPTNPSSPQVLIDAYASRITAKTRVIEVMHTSFLNGQIWPVREICRLGREKDITVIVDGAHALAHFPFKRDDLLCDFYGASLHKWLCAPVGTGMLYVNKERIKDLWPLMAAPEDRANDIRKFEEIGTHPAAMHQAVAEAIAFHLGIGAERKAARLRFLQGLWTKEIVGRKGARLLTNDGVNDSCGIRLLQLEGVDHGAVADWLLERFGIITVAIKTDEFSGLRITPNVYTMPDEIHRFVEAIHHVQDRGILG